MTALIQPPYPTFPKDDFVPLGESPIEIRCNQTVVRGLGQAALRLQPKLSLTVTSKMDDALATQIPFDAPVELKYGNGFAVTSANIMRLHIGSEDGAEAELIPNPERLVFHDTSNGRLSNVTFFVVNFPQFIGFGKNSQDLLHQNENGSQKKLGRAILFGEPWQIEIQEMLDTTDRIDHLKNAGGFGLTHVGRLTRKDGQTFTAPDAEKAIQNLHLFLSFAREAWAPIVWCAGYDTNNNRIYEDWGIRMATPWESRQGWFDVHHASWLPELMLS